MDTLLIIFISILGVVVLALFGILVWLARGISKRDLKIQDLTSKVKDAEGSGERVAEAKLAMKENEYKVGDEKIKGLQDRFNEGHEVICKQRDQINQLNVQIDNAHHTLYEYAAKLKEEYDKLLGVQEQKVGLERETLTLKDLIEKLKRDTEMRNSELLELQARHKLAVVGEQNEVDLWDLVCDERDYRLMKVLREIERDYPEFASDLAMIEGKSVGLPKLQNVVAEHGLSGQRGIYTLVYKKDTGIRYVGQAVDIKTRGYEHAKKMIGLMGKGTERLYQYRPEDFFWGVLERDSKDLNSAENYGIEFYGCREKGLNKK